ncbi:MAG: hypothetical protein ACOZQL_26385 [Myxococcota bacterium]
MKQAPPTLLATLGGRRSFVSAATSGALVLGGIGVLILAGQIAFVLFRLATMPPR